MVAAVVGEVGLLAAFAAVEPPAQRGGAAREDACHRPVMGGAEVFVVGTGVVRPMLREDVCQIQGHGFSSARFRAGWRGLPGLFPR